MNRILYPFSWIMKGAVGLRNRAFDWGILRTTRLDVPVISVGNLVVGGAGKTPLVQYLAGVIRKAGYIPGVVSRGYRRKTSGVRIVSDGKGSIARAADGGDEPVQVARRLPEAIVVVGERRVDAAKEAVRRGAQVVLLDDAYQHRYIGRDLNVLVMDGSTDLSVERVLPAGKLREPVSSAARADVVAVSNAPEPSAIRWLGQLERSKPVVCFTYEAGDLRRCSDGTPIGTIPSDPVVAFSGIAHHDNF
ncbi:MAG: tetraacyldisaccharide 4'-kinase, partial [Ignavibacteria bacterium]|nr:tetraacyldisaccharide 4'-kinase [Ignavibacteria bacterium]